MYNDNYDQTIIRIVRSSLLDLNITAIYRTSIGWLFSDSIQKWPYRLSYLLQTYPELLKYIKTIKQGYIIMYLEDFDLDLLLPIQLETIDLNL